MIFFLQDNAGFHQPIIQLDKAASIPKNYGLYLESTRNWLWDFPTRGNVKS